MTNYDSFSLCHLTDIFFRYSRRSKRVKVSLLQSCRVFVHEKNDVTRLIHKAFLEFEKDDSAAASGKTLAANNTQNAKPRCFFKELKNMHNRL